MIDDDEYYGSPQNVAAMKRSVALWSLLRDDPRFSYYGRTVGLSQPVENTASILAALSRLQGAAPCHFFPRSDLAALFAELEADGFSTDRLEHLSGAEATYALARQVLSQYALPAGIAVTTLNATTPGAFVSQLVDVMQSCGVMPLPASILSAAQGKGICLAATDSEGRPVSAAASYFMHPVSGPHADTVFWGMLSTVPDWRGRKLALILGALAIVHMWEEKGARAFMTGVRQGNDSSAALCARLGFEQSDYVYAICVDRQTLGRDRFTT